MWIIRCRSNGGAVGMNAKWDLRFLALASHISAWSKDPSTQVGAVIASPIHEIISLGYNGLARGVDDSPDRLLIRATKLALTLHAETNALAFARGRAEGCSIYTTHPPCTHCASQIIQAGLIRVVALAPDAAFAERWAEQLELSRTIFNETGIEYVEYDL